MMKPLFGKLDMWCGAPILAVLGLLVANIGPVEGQQGDECPLSLSPPLLEATARSCNSLAAAQVTTNSSCCKRLTVALGLARAQYAQTSGGVLLLTTAQASSCVGGLAAALDSQGLQGGPILTGCGVATDSFTIEGSGRCGQVQILNSIDAVRQLREVNLTALSNQCDYTTTHSGCFKCVANMTASAALVAGAQGTFNRPACETLLQIAILAQGADQPALADCFWIQDHVAPPACTLLDLSIPDTSVVAAVSATAGGSQELAMLTSVLTYLMLTTPFTNATGQTFLPDNQAASCYESWLDKLHKAGVTFNSTDRLQYALEVSDWQAKGGNCTDLTTVQGWEGVHLASIRDACSPSACKPTCQAATQDTAAQQAGPGTSFLQTVRCQRQAFLAAAAGLTADVSKAAKMASCVLTLPRGLEIRPILPPDPSQFITEEDSQTEELIGGILGALGGVFLLAGVVAGVLYRRRKEAQLKEAREKKMNLKQSNTLRWFSYAQLRSATGGFSKENFLGSGGSGKVYRGTLPDETLVAIKELTRGGREHEDEFFNEIAVISSLRHKNLVELKGCCGENGHWLVVYAYMPNLSLDKHLYADRQPKQDLPGGGYRALDWPMRYDIGVGAARGLAYLHEDVSPRCIHRDVKPSNILLDANYKARVADFGLAKFTNEEETHVTTGVVGTWGYLAPEYVASGQLTEKSDVYALGVVLLELVAGRKPVEPSAKDGQEYLVEWAWQLADANELHKLCDPRLIGVLENPNWKEEFEKITRTAVLCIHTMPQYRPAMGQCLRMLEGTLELLPLPPRPLTLFTMLTSCSESASLNAASAISIGGVLYNKAESSFDSLGSSSGTIDSRTPMIGAARGKD